MSTADVFVSPLASRNASPEMLRVWSARRRFWWWRRVWHAVAAAQARHGMGVTQAQVDELGANLDVTDHDLERAATFERELRHDVMAHVHAWGERCPGARAIIHLGLTSQDVVCNADLMQIDESLDLVFPKCVRLISALAAQAERWKHAPALGFTHFQSAQPVTIGRRFAGWAYDLHLAAEGLFRLWETARFKGIRGATGTQASFLALAHGDAAKVDRVEIEALSELVPCDASGMIHTLTGQTYPRIFDAQLLSQLACVAAVLHKIATDIRLLVHRRELDEPFETSQIGSSAMPYKRNPMRCERTCGLARAVINFAGNAFDTASTQWLERTLDDSSNRRIAIPESFLALDGALDVMHDVAERMVVYDRASLAMLREELPFMATENLMMAATKLGRDRQTVHEVIRRHAQDAATAIKRDGAPNDLLERLRREPDLAGVDFDATLDPAAYVGRSVEQVDRFVSQIVGPLAAKHAAAVSKLAKVEVRV